MILCFIMELFLFLYMSQKKFIHQTRPHRLVGYEKEMDVFYGWKS